MTIYGLHFVGSETVGYWSSEEQDIYHNEMIYW